MFKRFTDRARRVVVFAQDEARGLNHNWIGTEHLLLAVLREGQGVGAKALEAMQISLEATRQQVESIIGRGQNPVGEAQIPFTPRAKKVLELSLHESLQLGHDYIGTEHIVLGLIREGDGVAAQVLVKLGADLNRVRQQIIQLLTGHQGRPTTTATIGDELGDRLAAMAARLAAIERKLREAGASGPLSDRGFGGQDGAQQAVVAALPQRADFGETGLGERLDVGGELVRFAAVVPGVHAAARALGDVPGQQRVGGGSLPPGGPALGVPGGKTPPVLALAQGQVEPGERGRFLHVQGEVIAVEQ
jgi:ATP-dependent Clp protease ATP-binding subunit ClpC